MKIIKGSGGFVFTKDYEGLRYNAGMVCNMKIGATCTGTNTTRVCFLYFLTACHVQEVDDYNTFFDGY